MIMVVVSIDPLQKKRIPATFKNKKPDQSGLWLGYHSISDNRNLIVVYLFDCTCSMKTKK